MQTLDFSQIIAAKLNGDTVVRITDTVNTLWELQQPATDFLSFTDQSNAANTLTLSRVGSNPSALGNVYVEYSFDKSTWTPWTESSNTRTLTIPAGETVYLRGTNSVFNISSDDNYYAFSSTGNVAAGGDVKTLVAADGTVTALPNYFCRCMFKGMTTLTKAPAIGVLTLGQSSCRAMFDGCTNLTDVSLIDFSNITLGNASCYWMFRSTGITAAIPLTVNTTQNTCCFGMFTGCSSMTTASNVHLNATTLSNYAYGEMFRGCSSLVTFPSFTSSPLTLGQQSLGGMFRDCTSITTAPSIEIGSFTSGGTYACMTMFQGCTLLVDASNLVLSATTLTTACFKSMFLDCSALTTVPEIQATTLADGNGDNANGCMAFMFANCSSLAHIKVAFTSWNSSAQTSNLYAYNWVSGVAANGVFECPMALSVQMDSSHIPSGWRVSYTDGQRSQYFGINDESGSANTIKLIGSSGSVEASSDDGTTWTTYNASSEGTEIALPANGSVLMRHTGAMNGMKLTATAAYSVSGNIASLIGGSSFIEHNTIPTYAFENLFKDSTTLTSAKYLYFGNYTVATGAAFANTFRGCTALVDAPDLSCFTTLNGGSAMNAMFYECTSLVNAPNLSNIITFISNSGMANMFYGCTSLVEPSDIPLLTSVSDYAFRQMYKGCTSLKRVPDLHSLTTLGGYSMSSMFNGCTSLRKGLDIRGVTSLTGSETFQYMYYGCSKLFETYCTSNGDYTDWLTGAASYGVVHRKTVGYPLNVAPQNWVIEGIDKSMYGDENDYFTITSGYNAEGTSSILFCGDGEKTIDYSTDGGSTWNTITPSASGYTPISINQMSNMLVRHEGSLEGIKISSTKPFAVSGNIDSLIHGDNFSQSGATMPNNAFQGLFDVRNISSGTFCKNLVDASELYMGAFDTVSMLGCQTMFYSCTHLLNAPDMSSFTSMNGNQGCDQMFQNCKCLSEGVDLGNLTNLHWRGCFGMYSGCSQLDKAVLPNISDKSLSFDWWSTFGDFLDGTYSSGVLEADYSWNGLIPMDNTHIVPSGWSVKWTNTYPTIVSSNGYVSASPVPSDIGLTLEYRINGAGSWGSWQAYSSPVAWDTIGANNTIQFRQKLNGEIYGNTNLVQLTVQNCVTPTIANSGTTVTITAANDSYANASIYYTTDGSTPTSSSTPYTTPFTVNYGTTVKAISVPANTTWYAHSEVDMLTVINGQFLDCVYNETMAGSPALTDLVDSGVLLDNDMRFRIEAIYSGEYNNGMVTVGNYVSDTEGGSLRAFLLGQIYNDWGGSGHRKIASLSGMTDIDLTFDKTSCYNNLYEEYLWDDNDGNYDNTNNLNCLIDVTAVKFKRLRIWKPVNGVDTLVFDGRAALVNGVYGIYDMVSNQLLTNPNITMTGDE